MKKNISKNLILNSCLKNQQELIGNIEKRVKALETDAFTLNQSASQSENRTAGKIEILSALENELAFALKEMEYLKSLDHSNELTSIVPGAIVITDQLNFFIGISGEKIEIEGNVVHCISPKAPIYKHMEGLKKGNTYSYNEMVYEIKDVF